MMRKTLKTGSTVLVFAALGLFAGCSSDDTSTNSMNNENSANSQNNANSTNNTNNVNSTNNANSTLADMALEDAGEPDLGSEDAGPDASPVDAGVDMSGSVDMSMSDTGGADAGGADMGLDSPCAPGTTMHIGVADEIVACETTAGTVTQCDAAALCGNGWHLCSASEYRTHYQGAEFVPAQDATYWIGGCIRSGAAPVAPIDLACTDCSGTQTGSSVDVGWSCVNNVRLTSDQLYVGLRAATACSFVGAQSGTDAYWSALPSYFMEDGAVCCID